MASVVITSPDGRKVKIGIPEGATREQVAAKVEAIKAQMGSTTTTPTTESDPLNRDWYRPQAVGAGGAIGGTAASLAAAPTAAVTGPAGPFAAGVAGAGLGAGLGGQAFDVADALARLPAQRRAADARRQLGRPDVDLPTEGLTDAAGDVARDVTAGAAGEAGGQVAGALLGAGYSGLRSSVAARRAARNPGAKALQAAAARQGIPLSGSDVSQSKTARRIENLPGYFTIGGGKVQAFREGQVAATEGAARRVVDTLAQGQADALTAGLQSQGGARAALKQFRRDAGPLFDNINDLAGDAPIVPTSNLRSASESLVATGKQTALGAPQQARKLSALLGVSDETAALIEDAVRMETIPFPIARQIEAELGEVAFGGPSIAGPRAGKLKALYSAVRSDLDEFLGSDAGNEIAPALAEAKQVYSTGKQLFNDSAKRLILGTRNQPLAPEKVVPRVFRPGQIEPTIEYKLLVDDDTYAQATQAWLDGVIAKSTVQDRFSPAKFATEITKYERNGHLDVILPRQQAQAVRDVVRTAQAMTTAERLAGNPSGTAQGLVSVGTITQPASKALSGNLLGAAGEVFSMTGLPALVARGAFSDTGRQLLGGSLPDMAPSGPLDLRQILLRAASQGMASALGPQESR